MNRESHSGITAQSKSSLHRQEDAKALLKERRWRGAMYMAGYAVECSLKASLMRKFDCQTLAELDDELKRQGWLRQEDTIFTHSLGRMLRATGGMERLRTNARLWPQFNIVNQWLPAWRYDPDPSAPEVAEDFLDAVEDIRHWIENNV